ncbi:MAG: FecR domain-containing protein [Alphaproteobacteria bacterium]|nr:FecR domain-containing protein [Alphaproteobacteria bacterium]
MTTEDTAFRDAADWHARLAAPDASVADWEAFTAWLEADPKRRDAYTQMELLAAEIEAGRDALADAVAAQPAPPAEVVSLDAVRASRVQRWLRPAGAVAAAVAGLLAFQTLIPAAPVPVDYATGPAQQRSVTLADGTTAQLNAGTRIRVTFGDGERRVELAQGEAAFDVVHDPANPFVVSAGGSEIRDIGTSFAVRREPAQLTVTVTKGVVDLGPDDAPDSGRARVVAGQQAVATASRITVKPVDVAAATAWRQGRLVYTDAPLAEVAADIARYGGRPVTVAPSAAGLRFTGVLLLDKESEMIARLESLLPVQAERYGREIRLVARPRRGD